MIDLFGIPAYDRSLAYLSQIFGSMGGLLKASASEESVGSLTLMGTMFNTFNAIVLAVGAFIVIYVTIVGVVKTAHEGEMMGKQWSSLWLPLRMVMGIAMLIPTASGYSTIQIIIMWVIVQGIGAADTLWGTVLNYVGVVGSPVAEVTIPSIGVKGEVQRLYQGLACEATFKQKFANPDPSGAEGGYYCHNKTDKFCRGEQVFTPQDINQSSYVMGPNGVCGTVNYCNEAAACKQAGSLKCLACKAQKESLDTMINGPLGQLAEQLTFTDYSYRNFVYNNNPDVGAGAVATTGVVATGASFDADWVYQYCSDNEIAREDCCVTGAGTGDNQCKSTKQPFSNFTVNDHDSTNPPEGTVQDLYWKYSVGPLIENQNFIQASTNLYLSNLTKNVTNQLSSQRIQSSGPESGRIFEYARQTGWIMAGTLYYIITQKNNANLKDARPDLTVRGTDDVTQPMVNQGPYSAYRQNYLAAGVLANAADEAAATTEGGEAAGGAGGGGSKGGLGSELGPLGGDLNDALSSASGTFMGSVSAGDSATTKVNPLVSMQQAGYTMLFITQILFLALIIGLAIIGALAGITPMVLGTGSSTGPGTTAVLMIWSIVLPAILGLMGVLITVGGLLGVYVPLIPYVIFTLGAIGWFLSTIEAMVAGPLVALGILSPGGQSDMLGKAEPALMLLFNIFLRPALMIFGLVASMLLAAVVIDLINKGFGLVITSIADVASTGESSIAFDAKGQPYVRAGAAALAFNPLMLILILCAYTTLIVTAMNKCFSAIHVIPEKVTRWIGGQGEQYGEGEGVREMKGGVEAGGRGAESGAGTVKGGVETAGMRKQEQDKAAGKLGEGGGSGSGGGS